MIGRRSAHCRPVPGTSGRFTTRREGPDLSTTRIRVEELRSDFSESISHLASNIALAGSLLDVAFQDAAAFYNFEPSEADLAYLGTPPLSVMDWTLQRAAGQPNPTGFLWVKDAAMAIYAYENGLGFEPDRKSLTKAQRRKADARAEYFVAQSRIWQKGRPVELDVPLLLYLVYSIEILIGRRFPQSRPNELAKNGPAKLPASGPAFRLLQAAYSLASVRQHVMPVGANTIYRVAHIARGQEFKEAILRCGAEPWVGWPIADLNLAETVANYPTQCAFLFAETSMAVSSSKRQSGAAGGT